MSFFQTIGLGAIAGITIFLGLPLGRLRNLSRKWRVLSTAASAGILLFLFVEIFEGLAGPAEDALLGRGSWVLMLTAIAGTALGLSSLVYFERRFRSVTAASHNPSRTLALMIAIGIGLHNLSEGLAIGHSAASGEISLAALLIIGFAVHNATEGFGIVGPLAGGERPSWAFLAMLGLIGGGPTFIGTIVGYSISSPFASVLFLGLAAGAILYVIAQLLHGTWSGETKFPAATGLGIGFVLGWMTELLLKVLHI